MTRVLNFVGFQALWLACVIGAARGYPWIGPAVAVALVLLHFSVQRHVLSEAKLLGGAAVLGYLFDSLLVVSGLISFPPQSALGAPSTLWMVSLWIGFAATMRSSMSWLRGSPVLAALLGVVGGPLSYLAGARLGAIEFPTQEWIGPLGVGIMWAIAMPLLVWFEIATRPRKRVSQHEDPSHEIL